MSMLDTMHQHRPGTKIRNPNPTKPTPIIVADELTPSDIVTTSGTLPTTARLPPTPMNTRGTVSMLLPARCVVDDDVIRVNGRPDSRSVSALSDGSLGITAKLDGTGLGRVLCGDQRCHELRSKTFAAASNGLHLIAKYTKH